MQRRITTWHTQPCASPLDIIRAEPAKAIALGESLDSHQHVRGLIINIASEHSSVIAALKDKEAAEMAGTAASGNHVPRWTRASFVFVSVFVFAFFRCYSSLAHFVKCAGEFF